MGAELLVAPYCPSCGRRARCDCPPEPEAKVARNDRYDSLFRYYAQQYGLDWRLVKAQAIAESSLNPRAVSPVGAKGLMQFMPATWADWGVGDPFNPEASIDAGCRYMVYLLGCYGEIPDETERYRFALAAYNAGRGNINRALTLARGCSYAEWEAQGRPPGPWQEWRYTCEYLHEVTGPANSRQTIEYVKKIMGGD